jgi:hypothetical protein
MMARAIREGIGHDGRALFPLMPYRSFSHMSDEDLASVVVYLRSIKPIEDRLPQTKTPFPLSVILNVLPEPLNAAVPTPDLSTQVKRGQYLAKISDCEGCHTPRGRMTPTIPGMEPTRLEFPTTTRRFFFKSCVPATLRRANSSR